MPPQVQPPSFVVNLPQAPAGTPREGSPAAQCEWRSSRGPKPVTLVVGARQNSPVASNFGPRSQAVLLAQGSNVNNADEDRCGYLRLENGAYGGARTVDLDVASGSYQLPPCDYAKVSVRRFNATAGAPNSVPWEVFCSLSPGVLANPSVPRHTVLLTNIDGATGDTDVIVPQGAQWQQIIIEELIGTDFQVEGAGGGTGGSGGLQVDISVPSQFPSHGLWSLPRSGTQRLAFSGAAVGNTVRVEYFIGL